LVWLDLPVTFGKSFDEVTAQMIEGGAYQGYRYASVTEVEALLSGLGLQFSTNEVKNESQYQALESFLTMMGVPSGTRCCDAATIRPVYGLTNTPAPAVDEPPPLFWASFLQSTRDGYSGSPPNVFYNAAWVEPQSTRVQSGAVASAFMGSWLIQEVPEPNTLWLVALALFGTLIAARLTGDGSMVGGVLIAT
jgi:hypothetical protein